MSHTKKIFSKRNSSYLNIRKVLQVTLNLLALSLLILSVPPQYMVNAEELGIEVVLNEKKPEIEAPQQITIKNTIIPTPKIISYTVRQGDTLTSIAQMYPETKATPESIQWSNELPSDLIETGEVLKISPVEGLLYKKKKDESFFEIAKKYGLLNDTSSMDEQNSVLKQIAEINQLPSTEKDNTFFLEAQDNIQLIIPKGKIPSEVKPFSQIPQQLSPTVKTLRQASVTKKVNTEAKTSNIVIQKPIPGKMLWPLATTSRIISRGMIQGHTGVDYTSAGKTMVIAPSSGIVTSVGWENNGGGYVVRILFDNGIQALLAHTFGDYRVVKGQYISAGQVLVTMGSSGNSTGPHVHVEFRDGAGNLLNPLDYISG